MLLYIIAAKVRASFINANKKIKGIQIGDHEIKIENFADNTTIFLKDITCLNRIQVIQDLQIHRKKRILISFYSYFHKIFGTHIQKDLVYFHTKIFFVFFATALYFF